MHNVKAEGLHRLLMLVDKGDWIMPPTNAIGQSPIIPQLPFDELGEINVEAMEAEAAKIAAEDGKCLYFDFIFKKNDKICEILQETIVK